VWGGVGGGGGGGGGQEESQLVRIMRKQSVSETGGKGGGVRGVTRIQLEKKQNINRGARVGGGSGGEKTQIEKGRKWKDVGWSLGFEEQVSRGAGKTEKNGCGFLEVSRKRGRKKGQSGTSGTEVR